MNKLFTSLLILSVSSLTANAMAHFCGQHGATEDQKSLKWSNCIWTNNVNFEVKPLPSKPGPSDHAEVRYGGFILDVDQNINVGYLSVGDNSELKSTKKTIRVNKNMRLYIPSQSCASTFNLSGCTVDVNGSVEFGHYHKHKSAGLAEFRIEDSKINVRGDLNAIIPVNPQFSNETPACLKFALSGKTEWNFNGGATIDSIIEDDPEQWSMLFSFSSKDGNLPTMRFNRKAEFVSCDIEVNIKDDVKVGIYPLMEFNQKKSGLSKIRSVKLNGETYNLGDEIKVGKKTVKLYLGGAPRSKDPRTPNDLLISVK